MFAVEHQEVIGSPDGDQPALSWLHTETMAWIGQVIQVEFIYRETAGCYDGCRSS